MSTKHAVGIAAILCGCTAASAAQDYTPQKQPLTIPITLPGNRTVECVVSLSPPVAVSAVAFSPDGKTLAAGGYQEVVIWDLASATLSRRLGVDKLSGPVYALAFDKVGQQLAVGEGVPQASGAVRIFDLATGEVVASFEEPTDVVYCLALSPDGKLLAAGGAYAPVHVWDLAEKKLAHTIEGHGSWVLSVAFSPDGKFLATGSADKTVRVWEVGTFQPVVKMQQTDAVRGVRFSPDGQSLAFVVGGPKERAVRFPKLTDLQRYAAANPAQQRNIARQIRPINVGAGVPLNVVWAIDGKQVYVPCNDNTVKAFDPKVTWKAAATLSGHQDWVHCAAVSSDGAKVASGSADGTVRLYDAKDGKPLATLVQLSPRTEDWLILTAQGYLATSSAGAVRWNGTNLETPQEELAGVLEKPELVQKTIAGEKTEPPALK
jgi:WD40 repeat protein